MTKIRISFQITANVRNLIRKLLISLDGNIRLALTAKDVASLGLSPCDGYIVVKDLAVLNAIVGTALNGTTLQLNMGNYIATVEVIEWKNLIPVGSNVVLSDLNVPMSFWSIAAQKALNGTPIHPNLIYTVAIEARDLCCPS